MKFTERAKINMFKEGKVTFNNKEYKVEDFSTIESEKYFLFIDCENSNSILECHGKYKDNLF